MIIAIVIGIILLVLVVGLIGYLIGVAYILGVLNDSD